ncbi:MAG: hypothetical protein OHK0046_37840 [Anaerolineae bacterium]
MSDNLNIQYGSIIKRELRSNRTVVVVWLILLILCLFGLIRLEAENRIIFLLALLAGSFGFAGLITPKAIRTIRLYFTIASIATVLVLFAFLYSTDIPSLLLNLATELFGAIIIFIAIEQRIGSSEIAQFVEDEIISRLNDLRRKILGTVNSTVAKQLERQLGDLDIQPRLYLRPDATRNRFSTDTNGEDSLDFDQISAALVPGTSLIELYDQFGSLLILGHGGMGKTTSLLRITRELAIRAQDNDEEPIPIFLQFHRWHWKDIPLIEWITEEISDAYQISSEEANALIHKKFIVLILDGLDESPQFSGETVSKLNEFMRLGLLQGIVTSCRNYAYESLDTKLDFNMAVELMPLEEEQVRRALHDLSPQYRSALERIKADNRLYPVLTNPLLMKLILKQMESGSFPQSLENANVLIAEMVRRAVQDVADTTEHEATEIIDFLRRFCHSDEISIPQLSRYEIADAEKPIVDGLITANLLVTQNEHYIFAHQAIAEYICNA